MSGTRNASWTCLLGNISDLLRMFFLLSILFLPFSFLYSPYVLYSFSLIKESLCSTCTCPHVVYVKCGWLRWQVPLHWWSDGNWSFHWLLSGISKPTAGIHTFQDLMELVLGGLYSHLVLAWPPCGSRHSGCSILMHRLVECKYV